MPSFDQELAVKELRTTAEYHAELDVDPVGRMPAVPSSLLAQAWFFQVQHEYAQAFSKTPEHRRQMAAARKLAGDRADDVVAGHAGLVPICKVNNQDIPAPGYMLVGCVPLWVHYVREVQRVEEILREVDSG